MGRGRVRVFRVILAIEMLLGGGVLFPLISRKDHKGNKKDQFLLRLIMW
jgi:hypothetical protein